MKPRRQVVNRDKAQTDGFDRCGCRMAAADLGLRNCSAIVGTMVKAAVACALVGTALLKLISVGSGRVSFVERNMLFPFASEGVVLLGVAMIEVMICVVFLRSANVLMRYALITLVSGCFVAYRYSLHVIGTSNSCGCSGVWPEAFQGTADTFSTVSLLILLAVGWTGLATATCRSLCNFEINEQVKQA